MNLFWYVNGTIDISCVFYGKFDKKEPYATYSSFVHYFLIFQHGFQIVCCLAVIKEPVIDK